MRAKEIKIDDIFFKNNFDCSSFENDIYSQLAKTMARSVDIDLAKTPLVDILTGYIRYNEAEQELERYKNIIKNIKEEIELYIDITIDHFETSNEEINFELRNKCRAMREIKSEILEIIEKELKGE